MEEEVLETIESNLFRKCGDILFTFTAGERVYSLACFSCNELFVRLDEFVTHIDVQHADDDLFSDEEQPEQCDDDGAAAATTTTATTPTEFTVMCDVEDCEVLDTDDEEQDEFTKNEAVVAADDVDDVSVKQDDEEEITFVKHEDILDSQYDDNIEEMDIDEGDDSDADNDVDDGDNTAGDGDNAVDDGDNAVDYGDKASDVGDSAADGDGDTINDDADTNDSNVDGGDTNDCNDSGDGDGQAPRAIKVERDSGESDFNIDELSIGLPRIDDAMSSTDQKVLTLAVILAYEKQRVLWHPDIPVTDVKHKNEAYDKIVKSISKQLDLHVEREGVRKMIKQLNAVYEGVLQKRVQATAAGEKYTQPWYFDKLRFLERRNRHGSVDNGTTTKGLGLPLATLDDEQHLQLIEIYKSFPGLWDVQHIGYHTKKQRQATLVAMTQVLQDKMQLQYSVDKLQRKLYHIRYTCTQEKQRKLECAKLKMKFKPSCKFYEELRFLEDNVHPFKCPYCDDVFNAPQPFHLHKAKHDGSRPFKCPICKRGFMSAGNCTVHVRRHTQDYPYQCKECSKAFPSSSELTIHMRYHNNEKPYVCEICGQSFYRPSYLEYHKRRHENNRSFKCTECSKAFYDNHLLKEHQKVHLNVRDKVCNICGKAFTCLKHLRQHKQIHSDVKKYECKICNKQFAQYAGLSGHMKSHGTTVSGVKDLVQSGILE